MKKVVSMFLAMYLLVLNGPMSAFAAWTAPITINAPSTAVVDQTFGSSVAIDGDNVITVDPGSGISDSAYIYFYKSDGTLKNTFSIANAPIPSGSYPAPYPYTIGVSGDYAVVGLANWDGGALNCGAIRIYKTTDGGESWAEDSTHVCPTLHAEDAFGFSVAIDGDAIIAGAPKANSYIGAAYIYRLSGGTWSLEDSINPISPVWQAGWDVDVSGDYAITGSPSGGGGGGGMGDGLVQIWKNTAGTWSQDGSTLNAQTAGEGFGWSVSIDGTKAAIGVNDEFSNGAAYFYNGPGTWSLVDTFNGDAGESNLFGRSVDLSGDYAIVGEPLGEPSGDGVESGAAYVYKYAGGNWSEDEVFYADIADFGSFFGNSVGISGESATKSLVIGQYNKNDGVIYTHEEAGGGGAAVPEFSDYMIMLVIVIALGLMVKTVPNITGNPVSAA